MKKDHEAIASGGRKWRKMTLIMKLKFILLLFMSVQLSAAVHSQTAQVTLKMSNVTLEQVLWEIQKQTDFVFMYGTSDIAGVTGLNVNMVSKTVEEILDYCLKGTKLRYEISGTAVVIKMRDEEKKKQLEIKGVVKDSRGHTLPGVTILEKGTSIGVATDVDGKFVFVTTQRDSVVLIFSFVGMKTREVTWRGEENLEVRLIPETQEMEEVVVTGYQVIDKRQLTSAVTSVKMDDIMIPGVSSIDKMLEGQIPDLMVLTNSGEAGVAPKIRIRGTSTLIGNREPLWVVDGVVLQDPVQISPEELNDPDYLNRIGNAIAGLNPQDIERIDVLKDAAATALYGTKAANGVIVITTKRGHIGEPQVSYRGNVSLKLRPRYSDRSIDVMTAKERLSVSRELAESGYEYATNVTWVGYEKLLRDLYDRSITYEEFEEQVDYLGNMNTDWFALLMRDAVTSSHTLSVTGGTEKIRYYSSVGFTVEEDVIKTNLDRRYTGVLNLDMNLTSYLALSFNMNANTSNRKYYQSSIAPVQYAYDTSRAIPAYTEDGEYSFYSIPSGYDYNILNELANSSIRQENSSFSFRTNIDVKPFSWLKFSGILSYSISNTDIEGYWGPKTFYAAGLRRSNYGEAFDEYTVLPKGGELSQQYNQNKSYMLRFQADMNKYFGEQKVHNINASVGMEINSTKYDAYQNITRGYEPERGKQFVTVKPGVYPSYDAWMASNVPVITDNLTNTLAFYGSISYSYGSLFTINANMRYDGSNQFGERSNDKILPIWSTSFTYNFAEYLRGKTNLFNDLRLKFSYGYQGNMLNGQSPVMVISKQPEDDHYGEYVSTISVYPNPNLKWEKTGSLNLGLEFSMFDNLLMVNASYYRKKTKDAYMDKEISEVNGLASYVVNGGEIINSGYDLSFTLTPIKTDNLRWYISSSFSHADNEVATLPAAERYERTDFLNGTAIVQGKSVSSFYSYKFVGLDPQNGMPLFDDMEDEQEKLYGATKYDVFTQVLEESGRREPTIFGGLNTTLNYKRFRLNASFAYSLGAKTRLFKLYADKTARIRPENNLNKAFLNRWQYSGDEKYTDIPAFLPKGGADSYLYHWSCYTSGQVPEIASTKWEMYNYSNIRVVSANYLKCTNIGLNYSVNMDATRLSLCELSLSVSNPFIWASKELKGQTPVQSGFTEIQLSERPMFTFGISLTL